MRSFARIMAAAALATLGLGGASAQTPPDQYPQRAVKLILPFGPGSGSDIAARLIGEKLQATSMAVNAKRPEELAAIVRQQRAATARLAGILGIKAKE
jgi:hypothetical protein